MPEVKAYIRFLDKVKVLDTFGCWEWTGARLGARLGEVANPGTGHGYFRYADGSVLAHRWSWEHIGGNAPPGDLCVLHKCDNPKCVNPDHLFLGTRADNSADMVSKGRAAKKLTEAQAREIIALRATGLTLKEVAAKFNIDLSMVSYICKGKCWKNAATAAQKEEAT